MIVKLLKEHHLEFLSLKGGGTGSYESTPVKMPHCWRSHVTAQMLLYISMSNQPQLHVHLYHYSQLLLLKPASETKTIHNYANRIVTAKQTY